MAETDPENVELDNRTALSRYEIRVDGELAGLADYRLEEGRIIFPHTEVKPEFGGRGLATRLIEFAVTDARNKDLEIVPICPFVKDWVEENPEPR